MGDNGIKVTERISHIQDVSGVYKIYSKSTGRSYYGSSNNMFYRISKHIYSLNSGKHRNIYLQRHFNKYGIDDLEFTVLYIGDDYLNMEQSYINDSQGYDFNISVVANGLSSEEGIRRAKIGRDSGKCYSIGVKQYNYKNDLVGEFKSIKSAYRKTGISARIIKESIDFQRLVFGTYFIEGDVKDEWGGVKYEYTEEPFAEFNKDGTIHSVFRTLKDAENKTGIKGQSIHYGLNKGTNVLGRIFYYISKFDYYYNKYL